MQESELAREILAHLVKHPDAQDTLEGIVQWWIPEEKIKSQIADTREAIAELIAQKFIFEWQGKDSRTYYRLNRCRIREIKHLFTLKVQKRDRSQ